MDHRAVAVVNLAFLNPGAVVIRTGASGDDAPRSVSTKRRTLAYRAANPWSSTRSCQMAIAFRPRLSASLISSRYGSQALALGARPGRPTRARFGGHLCPGGRFEDLRVGGHLLGNGGFDGPGSVDTSPEIAGFGFDSLGRPRPRTGCRRFSDSADRFAADAGRRLNARQRPAHTPQRTDLVLFVVVQDVTDAGDGTCVPRPRQRLDRVS
jgi:hypothetical protein